MKKPKTLYEIFRPKEEKKMDTPHKGHFKDCAYCQKYITLGFNKRLTRKAHKRAVAEAEGK